MERYKFIKEIGDGTFGTVWRAIKKPAGEIVAIKKMKKKYYSWEECMNLREVKSLRKMNHPNIVKLKEVIREHDILYFIFEYMDCNLYQLIKDRGRSFSEAEVRNWCYQIFQGLSYMHRHGYFHRDLKPENLLVTKDIIKIADFGLAREISSHPPFTEYVSTRWYRAPEVLLQSSLYGPPVDMWAMGAIIAELLTLRPLFPGSSEADEIYKICSVIGSPNQNSWSEGLHLASKINYQFPQLANVHLSILMPSVTEDAINLISSLCSWDPSRRPSATEALQHPFFQPCLYVPPSLRPKISGIPKTPPAVGTRSSLDHKNVRRHSLGSLSNTKPSRNFNSSKMNITMRPEAQRRLDMGYQDVEKKEKIVRSESKLTRYKPPERNSSNVGPIFSVRNNSRRVSDTTEKFAKLTLSPGPVSGGQQPPLPSMKAGGLRGQADILGRSNEIPPARSYTRKVVG